MSLIGYEVPLLELEPTDQKAFLLIGAIIAIAVLSTGALKSWHRLNPRKSRDLIRPGNFRERMRKFVEAAAGAALLAFVVGGGTWLYADWATARQAFSMIFSLLIVVGLGQVIFGDRRAIPFVKPYDSFKRELPPVLVAAVVSPAIAGLVIQRFNPGALLPGVIAAAVVAILGNCPLYVRYMSMVLVGSISRSFPGRPGKFLDWCCTSGILRFAGSSYQFRHVELQTWLCPVTKQSSDGPIVDLGSSSEDATDGDEPGPPDEELSRAFNIALREVRNDADLNRRTRHWGIPITEIIMRLEQSRVLILHEVDDVFTTYSTTWNWIARNAQRAESMNRRLTIALICMWLAAIVATPSFVVALLRFIGVNFHFASVGGALSVLGAVSLSKPLISSRNGLLTLGLISAVVTSSSVVALCFLYLDAPVHIAALGAGVWVGVTFLLVCRFHRKFLALANEVCLAEARLDEQRHGLYRAMLMRAVRPAVTLVCGEDPWS
ncbi:MAG: hypothetical protein ACR2GH_02355 [Pseudonocardia sp.]